MKSYIFASKKGWVILAVSFFIFLKSALPQNHQPEVSSFEPQNTSNLVNLSTGNFVYNQSLLYVPGLGGGFDVNLFYHGDIKNAQHSSWIGLGWNINPGNILRTVNGFADDYDGQTVVNEMYNEGSQMFSHNYFIWQRNYNSNDGISYNFDFFIFHGEFGENGKYDVGTLGMHTTDDGDYYDAEEGITDILTLAETIASAGTSEAAKTAAKTINTIGKAYSTYKLISTLPTAIEGFANYMNYSSNPGLWNDYGRMRLNNSLIGGFHLDTESDVHLNANVKNKIYGPLYFHDKKFIERGLPPNEEIDCSTLKGGVLDRFVNWVEENLTIGITIKEYGSQDPVSILQEIHDVQMYIDPGTGHYLWTANPTRIAYDGYFIQGSTIAGSMQPYRTEIGSISPDLLGTEGIETFALNNFKNYKVGFINSGSLNYYTYHEGYEVDAEYVAGISWVKDGDNVGFECIDPALLCEYGTSESTVGNIQEGVLYGGNDIQWFSNGEIKDGSAEGAGFIDYAPPHATSQEVFRDSCAIKITEDSLGYSGIGGYMITGTDGTTYHYALPVYMNKEYTETVENSGDTPTTAKLTNPNKYATNWLLTTITGSDFVDVNNNHKADVGDWGYWVNFEYSRYAENYFERNPINANNFIISPDGKSKTFSYSKSEIYYLT